MVDERRIVSPLYDVFLEEGGVGEVLVEDPASGGHLRKPYQGYLELCTSRKWLKR